MRLHAKILLVVVPLAVLPLLVLGWLAFNQLQTSAQQRTSHQMATLLDQMQEHFGFHMEVARANVTLFADSSLMRAYAVTDDEEERYLLMLPSLLKLFKSYLRAYPEYYEIRFLLPDGYEDARATLEAIPNATEEEADTPFFEALARSPGDIYSQVLTNPDNGEIALQVGRRLDLINIATDDPLGTKSRLRGYLVVTMALDFLQQQIVGQRVGDSGLVFAMNKKGEIIYHPDNKRQGQRVASPLASRLMAIESSLETVSDLFNGEQARYSARSLHDNLILVGVLPEAEVLQEGQALGQTVVLVTLLTMLLTIVALLHAMQIVIVRPLQRLMRAVKEIGEGNLNPQLALSTRDELGQLAERFQDLGKNLKKSRDKIERLAYHDSLTGLPNRLLFREYLQHMIALARRENNQMAVLFLDLDNFKRVNDTLGHHIGDRLLKEMADRLLSVLRAEDFVYQQSYHETSEVLARLGGDEFIILLPRVRGSQDAAKVANRILEVMKEPFRLEGHELYNGTSIGITLFPEDGTEVNDLVKRADVAMYHAKEQGRNNFQFYSASYNQATTAHLSLEARLRRALNNGEFELFYQPQYETATCRLAGFEALLRWNDPQQGMIGPDQFIPIAEDSGLILPIGEWVLQQACRQASTWQQVHGQDLFMSVNVSAVQLQRQEIFMIVESALTESGLRHGQLDIELTESVLMNLKKEIIDALHDLKRKGVSISLDDFGTGYSSLNRLRQLPISKLKIDRSFVDHMVDEPQDAAIVSAVQHIADSLDLATTAEGVETPDQARRLKALGCDYLQGYLLSRPLPATAAEALLHNRTAESGETAENDLPCRALHGH